MISRIAITWLFIGIAYVGIAYAGDPTPTPPPSSFFQDVAGTRVLSLDLEKSHDPVTLEQLLTGLEQERTGENITQQRTDELHFAKALTTFHLGKYERAANLFSRFPSHHILRDAALLFHAKSLRKRALLASRNNNQTRAATLCRKSRDLLNQLRDYPAGPFEPSRDEEFRMSTLCYASALVRDGKRDEAEPLLLKLLSQTAVLNFEDQKTLNTTLQVSLKAQQDTTQRQRLAAEAVERFPQEVAFQAFLPKTTTRVKPPTPSPEELLPKAKTRKAREKALFRAANGYYSRGSTKKAVNLLIQIILEYPGSVTAKKAGAKIRVIFERTMARKRRVPSYTKDLKVLPTSILYALGKSLWEREYLLPAQDLFKHIVSTDPTSKEAGSALYFIGRLREDIGDWRSARKYFRQLATTHSASSFSDRAYFKVGWLSLLLGDYPTALRWLEYSRARAKRPKEEAQALYWTSKVYDQMRKLKEARQYVKEIGLVAPVSYYAVLVGQMSLVREFPPLITDLTTYPNHRDLRHLLRAKTFLAVGLPRPAAHSLKRVNHRDQPDAVRELALLFNSARDYLSSIKMASRLMNQGGGKPLSKDVTKAFFPIDYEKTIVQEAATNKLDPLLLFSLIKQESAYQEKVESRSGALGLMQLMPKTARNVAKEMSEEVPKRDDLLVSNRNVRLGARYLSTLLKRFDGSLVHALAAYNAGPKRVNVWKNRWRNLPITTFIELIPFEETRNYVKSIIRNYAYYTRILKNESFDLGKLTRPKHP